MHGARGFGLIELIVTLVVASLLVSIAVPAYDHYAMKAKVAQATSDIRTIEQAVQDYRASTDCVTSMSLNDLPIDIPKDPWGRDYVFVYITSGPTVVSPLRRDGSLNRVNTDFDLYSVGADGLTDSSLSATTSRDDIVRANNGAFVGLGEDY